jgi:ElaB/YqjD/DUF883 family membrane-anchored ribosome-binding protein
MNNILLNLFTLILFASVLSSPALAEKTSKEKKEFVKPPPPEGPLIDRSGPPLIMINGDEVSASSGKEEDDYSDEVITATEEWQKQLSKMDKQRQRTQEQILKDHDAVCKKGAETMKQLVQKGFLHIEPLEENCVMGGVGTKSGAALEQIQKTVGLYPNQTSLPLDAPDRGNAGKPTDLTLMALKLLPPRPETGYTQQDIKKAVDAINAEREKILEEKAKKAEEEQKELEKATKAAEKTPDAPIFTIALPPDDS